MGRIARVGALLSFCVSVWGADFQSGQAARVVIGQPSFSARQAGITPLSLNLSNNHLYVADASHHLLSYDLAQIPGPKDDMGERLGSACSLCGFSPVSSITQSVLPGIAAVSVFGKTVAIADPVNHQVLLWSDSTLPRSANRPDVVLGGLDEGGLISASTLIEPVSVAFDGKRLFVGDAALHRVLVWNSLPVFDGQPADAVLGQPSFTASASNEAPAADTIDRPVALASDGTNLFVADSRDHRILVFTAADMPLASNVVVNSATLSAGPIAPGTLVTLMRAGLTEAAVAAPDGEGKRLPVTLGGIEVFLNGESLPILEVSPEQIRAQFPYNLGSATSASLYVRTEHADGSVTISNATEVKLLSTAPGLFAFAGNEPRPGMTLHAAPASTEPATPVTADNPGKPGDILVLWAAGLGAVNSGGAQGTIVAGVPYDGPDAPVVSPVRVVMDGRPVEVLSATLPQGAIGIYEIRIVLPPDLPDSPASLYISQDGRLSNTVTIPVDSTIQ